MLQGSILLGSGAISKPLLQTDDISLVVDCDYASDPEVLSIAGVQPSAVGLDGVESVEITKAGASADFTALSAVQVHFLRQYGDLPNPLQDTSVTPSRSRPARLQPRLPDGTLRK